MLGKTNTSNKSKLQTLRPSLKLVAVTVASSMFKTEAPFLFKIRKKKKIHVE